MHKVVFLGQKPLGEACFQKLLACSNIEIVAVVTNSDADVGWWKSNEIAQVARQKGIPVFDNQRRDDDVLSQTIKSLGANKLISVQHNWVIPDAVLKLVDDNAFNLHLAKLPQYKGYNAFSHAILNKEDSYSVTLHWMAPKVDMGDIAYEASFDLSDGDTAFSIYQRACQAGLGLFDRLLEDLALGKIPPQVTQVGEGHFYSRNSLSTIREIKSSSSWDDIDLYARALYFPPYEPAFVVHRGKKYHIIPQTDVITQD